MPTRLIEGQATELARSVHSIDYDAIHDEIVVGNPVAQAVLTFRGGAKGEEPPIRVIQGPHTMLVDPDRLSIDAVHGEIFVPESDKILVFPRDANGDVSPIRVIQGPDTQLIRARGIAIDPVHDLIIVGVYLSKAVSIFPGDLRGDNSPRGAALLIFDRKANGNVKPRMLTGPPKMAFRSAPGQVLVSPKGWIVVGASEGGGGAGDQSTEALSRGVGIWSENDSGDAPPRWIVQVPKVIISQDGVNMALNPKQKELIIGSDSGFTAYSLPEIF